MNTSSSYLVHGDIPKAAWLHVMLDLETLGTGAYAPVLQIGAVAFDLFAGAVYVDHGLKVAIEPGEGTRMDVSTFAWWLRQGDDTRMAIIEALSGKLCTEADAVVALESWVEDITHKEGWPKVHGVWANGQDFDLGLLREMYKRSGMYGGQPKWPYNAARDTRTAFFCHGRLSRYGTAPLYKPEATDGVAHDALADAIYQAEQLCALFSSTERHTTSELLSETSARW